MIGQAIALSALVALGQTKAIITNNCQKNVYLWSVPGKDDLANNLSISPGKRYEEPWRLGTAVAPGVAIKVSTEDNGIYTGKNEINFQYSVDTLDPTRIWINIGKVRGDDFHSATLFSCDGVFKGLQGVTKQCSSTDDIELVLCGFKRTVPAKDPTPRHIISECIGRLAEHDDQNRMCSGRVVAFRRQKSKYAVGDVPSKSTLPLKTIMRLEAAKHTPQDAENSYSGQYTSTSLCDLLHAGQPDLECDEDLAQQDAELIYQDNCGPGTKDLYPTDVCESIRQDIENLYPDITRRGLDAAAAVYRGQKRLCIEEAYRSLGKFPYWPTNRYVKYWLNRQSKGLFKDISWTSDEDQCMGKNNSIKLDQGPRYKPCAKEFCHHGTCSDVEDALNHVSAMAGYNYDWTTDDDYCEGGRHAALPERAAPVQPADNTVTAHRLNDVRNVCIITANEKLGKYYGADETERLVQIIFPNTRWTDNLDDCSPRAIAESRDYHRKLMDKKMGKTKKCLQSVLSCEGKVCKRVKKDLNKLSQDVGEYWSWTDDEKMCVKPLEFGPEGPHDVSQCVLGQKAYTRLQSFWGRKFDETLNHALPGVHRAGNTNCDPTYDRGVKKWFHEHKVSGKRPMQCVKPYCNPFNADCSDVEDDLEEISKNIGREIDWTTDDDACLTKKRANTAYHDTESVCESVVDRKALDNLRYYWGKRYEDVLDKALPERNFEPDLENEHCTPTYTHSAKEYYEKHVEDKGKRCASSFCKPFGADCSDVEDELEIVSKAVGLEIDWTTDEDVCSIGKVHTTNYVVGRQGRLRV